MQATGAVPAALPQHSGTGGQDVVGMEIGVVAQWCSGFEDTVSSHPRNTPARVAQPNSSVLHLGFIDLGLDHGKARSY